jgi:hypothetical protein
LRLKKFKLLLVVVSIFFLFSEISESSTGKQGNSIIIVSLSGCLPDKSWPDAETAIYRELQLLDIPVKIVYNFSDCSRFDIKSGFKQVSSIYKAAAVLRIVKHGFDDDGTSAYVELWIDDKIVEKRSYRIIKVTDLKRPDAATIVAVKAVDALRASFLEIRMKSYQTAEKIMPSEKIAAFIADTSLKDNNIRHAFSFGFGGALLLNSASHADVTRSGFSFQCQWNPFASGAIGFEVLYAPFGSAFNANNMMSDLDFLLIRGELIWNIFSTRFVQPFISAGGGSVVVFVEGKTMDGRELLSDVTGVGYLGGGLGINFIMNDKFKISTAFKAGSALPEIKLIHAGQKVAVLAHPLFDVVLNFTIVLR